MTDPMTALVRRAAQHSDEEIVTLTGSAAEADLMTRILAVPEPVLPAGRAPARTPARRPRRVRRLATLGAVAAAAAVGVTALVSTQGDDPVVWASEAIALADQTPRLLIDAPDWRVGSADELDPGDGTMWFTDGAGEVHLSWSTSADVPAAIASREGAADAVTEAVVAGHRATVFSYGDGDRAAVWQQDDAFVELMTWRSPMDDAEFADLLDAVTQVDAGTWLSALPGDIIRSEDIVATADAMLGGAALPDGLRVTPSGGVTTRHALAYTVEAEARCAWIGAWIRATDAGDAAAADAATTALAGVPDWPVQSEIHGHDDPAAWTGLSSIVDDGVLPGGRDLVVSGDTEVEGWQAEFGCYRPVLLR
ncbi:hypothetical protein [Jiangella sp. DSM 45060]|uniref:hypothetical protein n=1 Tax=Jiangella sp. DSM 45060 TaxID=1798224 RepID=UPI00087CA8C5|nr:hypothetical protein [Jiangella sp. DSM 45060]SDT06928.1 hypothetical protein SAMN04515669_2688 [Jiangella sp. DSM 45060]